MKFLDIVAKWGKETFPHLIIDSEGINRGLPVKFYAKGDPPHWVVSIQHYTENDLDHQIAMWNGSSSSDTYGLLEHVYLNFYDKEIFSKFKEFIEKSDRWSPPNK